MLKLNLGCGDNRLDGYENIDLIDGENAYPLLRDKDCYDEIRASHLLEHFGFEDVFAVLKDWSDKLKPGGVLKIAVPDFSKIVKDYICGTGKSIQSHVMGGHRDENDHHKAIFDEAMLSDLMKRAGLVDIKPFSDYNDSSSLPCSLNLQGTKSLEADNPIKIAAVMSMPRLAFTDNLFCGASVFPSLGISFERGTGAFWGQVLTRMLEKNLDCDYIITCDYDTYFTKEQVHRLCQLAVENPEYAVISPLQIHRESDQMLTSIKSPEGVPDDGEARVEWLTEEMKKPLVEMETAHFGLTIIDVNQLKQLTKPWFMAHPGDDGRWEEGRIDEDIHFWRNLKACGMKCALATEIKVGHLQMMCTVPGTAESGFKPEHHYMNDINANSLPDHCEIQLEIKA
jgi:predicted SAM-dependent methyltransferase